MKNMPIDEVKIANEVFRLFANLFRWRNACLRNEDEDSLREFKANRKKFYILFCVNAKENCTLSELEKMLVENRSTASAAVSKLYREGYISKNQPEKDDDGRKVYFKVTRKGKAFLERMREDFTKDMGMFINSISEEKKSYLINGVESLNKVFDSIYTPE